MGAVVIALALPLGATSEEPPLNATAPTALDSAESASRESAARAQKKQEEMLSKMQASVEEIAGLYGNPTFLQVFTNDRELADELKVRLKAEKTAGQVRREVSELEKKRDDLMNAIALENRECARLSGKLARQRAALDAIAQAVEGAKKAVEDTWK